VSSEDRWSACDVAEKDLKALLTLDVFAVLEKLDGVAFLLRMKSAYASFKLRKGLISSLT
jgi:hypothetical protein